MSDKQKMSISQGHKKQKVEEVFPKAPDGSTPVASLKGMFDGPAKDKGYLDILMAIFRSKFEGNFIAFKRSIESDLAATEEKHKIDFAALNQSIESLSAKHSELKAILGMFMEAVKQKMDENNSQLASLNQALDRLNGLPIGEFKEPPVTVVAAISTEMPPKLKEPPVTVVAAILTVVPAKLKEPPVTPGAAILTVVPPKRRF